MTRNLVSVSWIREGETYSLKKRMIVDAEDTLLSYGDIFSSTHINIARLEHIFYQAMSLTPRP